MSDGRYQGLLQYVGTTMDTQLVCIRNEKNWSLQECAIHPDLPDGCYFVRYSQF